MGFNSAFKGLMGRLSHVDRFYPCNHFKRFWHTLRGKSTQNISAQFRLRLWLCWRYCL